MPRKYLAFDIETAKVLPRSVRDLKAHRPLGISCAVTLASGENEPRLWYAESPAGSPAPRMGRRDAANLVHYLCEMVRQGYTVTTWNGLGFDFDILAEESGVTDECQTLARGHVDMMFHFLCELGYPLRLDVAAKGIGLPGKLSGVDGAEAPQMWADGRYDEVLEYAAQDVRITLELAQTCERQGSLQWTSGKGKPQQLLLPRGWLTVDEARRLPEPDTSWMDNPIPRSRFTEWLG